MMGDPVEVTLGEMVDLLGRDTFVHADGHGGPAILILSADVPVSIGDVVARGTIPFEEWASNDPRLDSTPQAKAREIGRVDAGIEWVKAVGPGTPGQETMRAAALEVLEAHRRSLMAEAVAAFESIDGPPTFPAGGHRIPLPPNPSRHHGL